MRRIGADQRGDVTAMLDEVRAGRPDAQDRLVRAIHDDLLKFASGQMHSERPATPSRPAIWLMRPCCAS